MDYVVSVDTSTPIKDIAKRQAYIQHEALFANEKGGTV